MTKDPWAAIDGHSPKRLTELFAENSERLATMSLALGGMYFDWSKTHLDERLVAAFEALAEAQGFAAKREALFTGAVVNASESPRAKPSGAALGLRFIIERQPQRATP